jgi:hypothetical protein
VLSDPISETRGEDVVAYLTNRDIDHWHAMLAELHIYQSISVETVENPDLLQLQGEKTWNESEKTQLSIQK